MKVRHSMDDEGGYVIGQVLDSTVKRMKAREDVKGILICDFEGLPLRTTLPPRESEAIAAHVSSLIKKINLMQDSLNQGPLESIFIEMHNSELIITPDVAAGFSIVVLREKTKKIPSPTR